MATTIHRGGMIRRPSGAPAPGAICTGTPWDALGPGVTITLTDRVNCPDCLAQLAYVEQLWDGRLHMHWPFPLDGEPAAKMAA